MCGFAGEYVFGGGRADPELAERMARALVHRGPDEHSRFLSADARCAIGFNRLAVIDVAGSHQPMSDEAGRVTLAFNGEIYNFRELRQELAAQGARFRTAGDTEVLLHLYARHGQEMFDRLDGMFALAIYDAAAERLLLARDRLGEKPLWYSLLSDRVVFASEAKALLVHDGVDRSLNPIAIQHYVSLGYIPAPLTAWAGVHKLRPAHWLSVEQGEAGIPCRYWRPQVDERPRSKAEWLAQIREDLPRCVASRMVSDVPLGALLSGGVDSAVIVALMCKAAGRAGGVRTFTAGFESALFDERDAARRVAEHLGTEHTEIVVRPEPAKMLDEVVQLYDEPFADSSALPTLLICRAARQHVTVALTGDGGDEVFGGYDRYRAMQMAATMGPGAYAAVKLAALLARPLAGHEERGRARRLIRFADQLTQPPAEQYCAYRRLFDAEDLKRLFSPDWVGERNLEATAEWFWDLYEEEDLPDEITRCQQHDLLTYLPDDLLVKTDIASMSCSLELRAPMLEAGLVCAGLSLPSAMKISARRGKVTLREAFVDMLPPAALAGRKRGFGVPLGDWLRGELREVLVETLMDPAFLKRGIFDPIAIGGLVNDHLRGRDDHRHRLWALLVLARWLEKQA